MNEPTNGDVPESAEPNALWKRIEFEELQNCTRISIDTIHRLANMTFVINPALGVGYYYIYYEKRELPPGALNIAYIGIFIALLGFLYNLGALTVYLGSHRSLQAILIRMREIETTVHTKIHKVLEVSAPHSYSKYWGKHNPRSRISGDYFTRGFLFSLSFTWLIVAVFTTVNILLKNISY